MTVIAEVWTQHQVLRRLGSSTPHRCEMLDTAPYLVSPMQTVLSGMLTADLKPLLQLKAAQLQLRRALHLPVVEGLKQCNRAP